MRSASTGTRRCSRGSLDLGIRDGIWAPHWYDAVMSSTGFGQPDERPLSLDAEAQAVADACRPDYDYLSRFALRSAE